MIEIVLNHLNNYFMVTHERADLAITGATITGVKGTYLVGQYINIYQSILNDGVYKILSISGNVLTVDTTLTAEQGVMYLFGLGIPKTIIDIADKVSLEGGNIKSESQGTRSVTYTDNNVWTSKYSSVLNAYRRMYDDRGRLNVADGCCYISKCY